MKQPCVYIMASKRNGTLYAGVTADLARRVWAHKGGTGSAFTRRHGVSQLVWYEPHPTMESAILREKQIKEWKRLWKLQLIEEFNPDWPDLHADLAQ